MIYVKIHRTVLWTFNNNNNRVSLSFTLIGLYMNLLFNELLVYQFHIALIDVFDNDNRIKSSE